MIPGIEKLRKYKLSWASIVQFTVVSAILIFYALVLGSCTSAGPGIPSLFYVKISQGQPADGKYEVRSGYIGICAGTVPYWNCGLSLPGKDQKFYDNSPDGFNERMIGIAYTVQKQIMWYNPPAFIAGGCFFIGAMIFWLQEKRATKSKLPGEKYKQYVLALLGLTMAMNLLGVIGGIWVCRALTALTSGDHNGVGPTGDILITQGKALWILQIVIAAFELGYAISVFRSYRAFGKAGGGSGGAASDVEMQDTESVGKKSIDASSIGGSTAVEARSVV